MQSSLVVYKASAGSGKTFTLAVQYIKLLITSTQKEYRNTLAVTFTNKATAEMKERILEQLYGISRGLDSSKGYVKALQDELENDKVVMSLDDIRRKCGDALHDILHDYSRFRVETIDSFFQSVLRNLAHELGLSAKMQVDLNDKEVLNQAVDNIVDGLRDVNGGCPEGGKSILDWINNYIRDRLLSGEKWDVRDDIKKFATCIFSEEYMSRDEGQRAKLVDEDLLKSFREELEKRERKMLAAIKAECDKLVRDMASCGLDFDTQVTNSSDYYSFINKIQNYKDTIGTSGEGDFFWGKRLGDHCNDPVSFLKDPYRKDPALVTLASAICPKFIHMNDVAHQYLEPMLNIRLALKHLNPMRLLGLIDEEVRRITSEANRFILARTPILLSQLIKDTDAPFVFEKMGTLFHNVMIDEFQDTSRLQWQNFKVLMLENQSQGGHDLLVGDIKQSIYRWRNGDWSILANIDKEIRNHKPNIKDLDTNYRSEHQVIQFNNNFFWHAARYIDSLTGETGIVSQNYGDVVQGCKKKEKRGWVRTAVYHPENKDWETAMLDDLCQQVEALHEGGIPYEEMCILQRDRNQVQKLIDHFKANLPHVSLVSDEAFNLESSRALTLIICALRYLVSDVEQDPVPVRLLMQHYMKDIMKQEVVTNDFAQADPASILPQDLTTRREDLINHPLSELCEEIYTILDIKRIEGEDSYLLYFFDELAAYLQNAPGDITSFLEYWDKEMYKKAIPACKVNGIFIITIHKSKGLQYHTVLMPYCNFKFNKIKNEDLLWCEPEEDPFSQMGVLPIHPSRQMENSIFAPVMKEELLQKGIEELNALYVAFTRAEKNLLVWTKQEDSKTAGNVISSVLGNMSGVRHSKKAAGKGKGKAKKEEELTLPVLPDDDQIDEKKKPEMVTLDCEKTDDVIVYSLGQPEYSLKEEEQSDNRMLPDMTPGKIRMCSFHRKHNFKQSTEGMVYMEELDSSIDHEKLRTVDGLTYAQQGSLLHEIFSKIERAEQLDEVIREYVDKGVLTNGDQVKRISGLIGRAIRQRQAKPWFDGSYNIQNECEITHINPDSHKPEVLRPDRVMMNGQEIIVVDFKFGKPNPEEYHGQVKKYMSLLRQMYPGHEVKGYLWYVYRNKIEEV